jgi:hypothetical protein
MGTKKGLGARGIDSRAAAYAARGSVFVSCVTHSRRGIGNFFYGGVRAIRLRGTAARIMILLCVQTAAEARFNEREREKESYGTIVCNNII